MRGQVYNLATLTVTLHRPIHVLHDEQYSPRSCNVARSKKGKGRHSTFSWGACLEYHSARKFEFDSHLAEKPDACGAQGGLLITFLSSTKSGVEAPIQDLFSQARFCFQLVALVRPLLGSDNQGTEGAAEFFEGIVPETRENY